MSVPRDIAIINEWLDEVYSHDILRRPYYRVAFTTGQLEKRKGVYQDFYGPIFLREFYGVREQPKYLYHPRWRDRWVLERLDFSHNPELVLENAGHYEPLYVFYDEKGEYLKPTLRAIQFFMTKLLMRKPWKTQAEKDREIEEMDKGAFDAEVEVFMGAIDEYLGGDIASAIRDKSAVVNPGVIFEPDGKPHFFNRGKNGNNGDSSKSPAVPSGTGVQAGDVSV